MEKRGRELSEKGGTNRGLGLSDMKDVGDGRKLFQRVGRVCGGVVWFRYEN